MAGGDQAVAADVRLAELAPLLRTHLPVDDPLIAYADRLEQPLLGRQRLRGYLSGSIDVVLRIPSGDSHRFVVVDYKTNRLGDLEQPATSADYGREQLAAAMLHSDYPLQALLYSVVLHRYLRWRLPAYDPDVHLGGVIYLYLRGMCGPETPLDGRSPGRGVQLAGAGRAGTGAVRSAGREGRMTTTVDEFDSALALTATGMLREFNQAGVLVAADVHVASRLTTMLGESDESVALACALVVRAVRAGSVCLDLTEVRDEVGEDGTGVARP